MADNVIGDAVIEVGADGAKFKGDLEGLEKQSPSIGTRVSGAIGKTLKAGLIGVGAVAGAALAKTLFGGFNRLANIDQATKKLEGLGHTGKSLQTIMDNALASVKGTAFGLDEAATVAANLVAAGIKPGSQLEEGLRLVANTASVAGVSMAEVGDIFTEVAAGGKVTGDTLARLQARGIPALQLLADQMDVSREAAAKMVKAGEVDFDTFANAINDSMGEAALIAGESFRGMLANIGAAMNRLGAVALTPAFEGVKTVMPKVIALFDRAATALAPLVDKIAPKVQAFFDWLGGVIDGISFDGLSGGVSSFSEIMLKVSNTVQDVMLDLITKLPDIMTEVLPAMASAMISKVSFVITALGKVIEGMVQALDGLLPILVDTFVQFLPQLVDQVVALTPVLLGAITVLIQAVVSLLPVLLPALIEGAVGLFMALVQGVVDVLPVLLETIVGILPVLIESLLGMIPVLLENATSLFLMLVQAVIDILPILLDTIISLLPEIVQTVVDMLPDLLDAAIELFLALVQGVLDILPELISTILGLLPVILDAVLQMLPALIDGAFQLFYGLILGLLEMLPELLTQIIGMLPQILMTLLSMLPQLIETAITLFLGIVQGVIEFTPQLITTLIALGPQIYEAIKGLVGELKQAGIDLIQGLIDGMGSMVSNVANKAKEIATGAIDTVKGWFGINSPSKVFKDIGVNVVQGLVKGLDDNRKKAASAVDRLLREIDKGVDLKGKKDLMKFVAETGGFLDNQWKRVEANLELLEDARDKLADLQDSYASLRAGVANKVSGALNLTDAIQSKGPLGGSQVTFSGIANLVSTMKGKAQRYATLMGKLVRAGFPPAFVQMIAGYGLDAAIAISQALLSGSDAERASLISDFATYNKAADRAGKFVADQMYAVGIQAQKGVVAGLKAQDANLVQAAESIADLISRTVKKKLGIASPSKVMKRFGEQIAQGLIDGLDKMGNPVERAMSSLVSPVNLTPPGRSDAQVQADAVKTILPTAYAGAGSPNITVKVSLEDLAQLKDLEAFLNLLQVRARMGSEGGDD